MNYLDLFHGIGGFAYGAYLAGMKFENHLCSDIEPYCQKLYKLRFPDSIQLGDITKIDTQELINKYGTEWIITGGFPCQDISIAGKGAGITGSRSGLWFEYWRIIRDLRPQFAIMENVAALTFRGLDVVLGSLAEIGYNAEWTTLRACQFGMPHSRRRMWIIAYSKCSIGITGSDRGILFQKHGKKRERTDSTKWGNDRKLFKMGQACSSIPNTQPSESDILRVDDGIPEIMDRLKGLGNSIVPQIAELLFRQIKPLIDNPKHTPHPDNNVAE